MVYGVGGTSGVLKVRRSKLVQQSGEEREFFESLDIGDRERLYFKATEYPLKLILTSNT
jgi:hypothetical protein